ncbi:MAG: acylphosphatase [Acidiferrobacterales bacterium]
MLHEEKMGSSYCVRFVVSGRVQGVFFRVSTRTEGERLGLCGRVRNRDDGTVEVVACGGDQQLRQLEEWLWRGPPGARVTRVERFPEKDEQFSGFNVHY